MNYRRLEGRADDGTAPPVGAARARSQVVKNTLMDRVAKQLGWSECDPFLTGPSAMVTGGGCLRGRQGAEKFVKEHEKCRDQGRYARRQGSRQADVDAIAKCRRAK